MMKAKEQLRLQACRLEAKARLQTRGRWLSLVLYAILAMFLIMLPFAIVVNVAGILSVSAIWFYGMFYETVLPYLLMIPIFLLLTCPGIVFVMRGVVSTVTGERQVARGKHRYGRDLGSGLFILGRLLLPIALVLFAWCFPRMWFAEDKLLGVVIAGMMACATAVLALLWLWLTRRSFFVAYFVACGCTLRVARRRSRAMVADHPRLPTVYLFSFIGSLVLSVLTLGVFFIFWTLPLMWATYVCTASSQQNEQSPMGSNE